MATLIDLKTHADSRGKLTVIEQVIPFAIKRIFYMYSMDGTVRGGHRHKHTVQAIVCLQGMCVIRCNNGTKAEEYVLDNPNRCLVIQPEDWHQIGNLTADAIILVLASKVYDPDDYIYDSYP